MRVQVASIKNTPTKKIEGRKNSISFKGVVDQSKDALNFSPHSHPHQVHSHQHTNVNMIWAKENQQHAVGLKGAGVGVSPEFALVP